MSVSFDNKKALKEGIDCLYSIKVEYNCEWPVEIIIDRQTILRKYNRVFRLLVHIKYAKYLMEKRDYHIKQPNLLRKTSSYTYAKNFRQQIEDMGAKDSLLLQRQIMLGKLLHLLCR